MKYFGQSILNILRLHMKKFLDFLMSKNKNLKKSQFFIFSSLYSKLRALCRHPLKPKLQIYTFHRVTLIYPVLGCLLKRGQAEKKKMKKA